MSTKVFARLYKESGCSTQAAFANRIQKKPSDVSAYLGGTKSPGPRVTVAAARRLLEWDLRTAIELQPLATHAGALPQEPGVFVLYDSGGNVLYVGQAGVKNHLRKEVAQTLQRKTNFPVRLGPKITAKNHPKYRDLATLVSAYVVPSARLRHNLEALLLRIFANQSHNNKLGNFK